MDQVVLSGAVGVLLALLDFFGSTFYSSRISMTTKLTSVALTLAGFMGRLGILSLIFYALAQVKSIHFQMTLLTFALCFTLCLTLKTIIFYRRLKSIQQKPSME
jgi:hypothetical protein